MCIANLYLQIMKNQMSDKISSVKDLLKQGNLPHKGPILYRWWFVDDPDNSKIVDIIRRYSQIELSKCMSMTQNGKTYYALYFGKGINGRRRIKNHMRPPMRTSTLRRTIAALLETTDEERITHELQQCYYEWWECDCNKETLEDNERKWIKEGYYPLNLKENNKISKEWKNYLQTKRKELTSK